MCGGYLFVFFNMKKQYAFFKQNPLKPFRKKVIVVLVVFGFLNFKKGKSLKFI
jgi:hypothetical protein